jgi:hypothetical protein
MVSSPVTRKKGGGDVKKHVLSLVLSRSSSPVFLRSTAPLCPYSRLTITIIVVKVGLEGRYRA